MDKLLIAAVTAFIINFPAMAGESTNELLDIDKKSTAERALEGKTAQEILNEINCKDKEPGVQIKDETDSLMHTCPDLNELQDEGRFSEENVDTY